MTMNEFYNKYNLNKYYFAEIAGVGSKTLKKFADGKPIREDSKARIEKAMQVTEKYNLVRPKYDDAKGIKYAWYRFEFRQNNQDYIQNFKRLLKEEA